MKALWIAVSLGVLEAARPVGCILPVAGIGVIQCRRLFVAIDIVGRHDDGKRSAAKYGMAVREAVEDV